MKILFVASTNKEVEFIEEYDKLITGIGIFNCMFNLTNHLKDNHYDLVIMMGVCGSYNLNDNLGDAFLIDSASFADTGFLDNNIYRPLKKELLKNQNIQHFKQFFMLESRNINTVNLTIKDSRWIDVLKNNFDCSLESMESACLNYVCNQLKINFLEIRSISNYVKEKSEYPWDIEKAILSLKKIYKKYFFNPKKIMQLEKLVLTLNQNFNCEY